MLLVTAQQLHPKGDALVPLPGQDADVAAVERRLEDVLLVNVVVAVASKDLGRQKQLQQSFKVVLVVKQDWNFTGRVRFTAGICRTPRHDQTIES